MQGAGLRCAAFQLLLFAALRTLVDRLGVTTFNVGVYNIPAGAGADGDASGTVDRPAPLLARCCFFFFLAICLSHAERFARHAVAPGRHVAGAQSCGTQCAAAAQGGLPREAEPFEPLAEWQNGARHQITWRPNA